MHLGSSNKYLREEFIRQGMVCPWNCRMNTVNIEMRIRGVPPEFRSSAAERGTRICRIREVNIETSKCGNPAEFRSSAAERGTQICRMSEVNIETSECGNPAEFRSSAAEPRPGIYSKYNTSFIV